jgi:hypothetical protein
MPASNFMTTLCCRPQVSTYGLDALEKQHQQLQADAVRVEELNAEVR